MLEGSEALDPGLWPWKIREAPALTDPGRASFSHRSRLSSGAFAFSCSLSSGQERKLQHLSLCQGGLWAQSASGRRRRAPTEEWGLH